MMFNSNTHALIHGMRGRDSVLVLTMSNVVHSSAVYVSMAVIQRDSGKRAPARQLYYLPPAGCCWVAPSRGRAVNGR